MYTVIAQYEQSNYWEKELNEDTDKSTTISLNNSYNGTSRENYDDDYYYFELSSPGAITVNFQYSKLKSTKDIWRVYLLDENEKTIKKLKF